MTKRYSLKHQKWPQTDRDLWARLVTKSGLLEDGGAGAHWADETKRVAERDYGYWLQHLLVTCPDALREQPEERVTPERIRSYCRSMQDVSALTRTGRVSRLLAVARGAAPNLDWRWLVAIARRLDGAARREGPARNKESRIRSSGELFSVGVSMMRTAEVNLPNHSRAQAKQYRDGLMIAFLAARPLRIKNFAKLRLGQHVVEMSDGYGLYIPGNETKTGQPIESDVPDDLVPFLKRYLDQYRPAILRRHETEQLWVHSLGRYTPGSLSMKIAGLTEKLFGVKISPHLFRDCAATTIAIEDPEHVMSIAGVLGHSSLKTSERHYNQARSIEAGRRYQTGICSLRDEARPIKRKPHRN